MVLFAFAALFGKWIALPATAIVVGRTTFAALALVAGLYVRGQRAGRPSGALAANGALLALHWSAFFAAVQAAGVAIGLLGYASFPLFVVILEHSPATHAEERGRYAVAGLVVLGLLLVVPAYSWSDRATQGLVLGLVSGLAFAGLAVRNRRLVATRSATQIALWQNVFATAWLLPVAMLGGAHARPSANDLALLAVLGVACTAFAHTLFIASMRRVSAHVASVVAALEPVYGIALAAWLLGELPEARTLVGAVLIVAASLVASWRASTAIAGS